MMKNLKEVQPSNDASNKLWTIGHSTRSADEFIEILRAHQIQTLGDVRSFPGSRRYPHFNKAALAHMLEAAGINYVHLAELGGRRRASPDSRNTAWKNSSFRGYADYMESDEFQKGINVLLELGRDKRIAVMCAEALWWRCHRSLIADFLKAKGVEVTHILDAKHAETHPYTSAARIINGRLSYEGLLAG
jgi:uncharacterized protein (DUF488 family)